VNAVVADATHGPFDWLWVQHDIDTEPPQDLAIEAPATYANAYTNTVQGSLSDPSGAPLIELEVQPGGTIVCPDATPYDGEWTCVWNAQGAADGTQFELRARAADRFGNWSGWTDPHTVTADATDPTVSLSEDTQTAFDDGLLTPDEIDLSGLVEDDRKAAQVRVCSALLGKEEQNCSLFDVTPGATPAVGNWYARPPVGDDNDGERHTLSFYGIDSVGNRSAELTAGPVRVDLVTPVLNVITASTGAIQAFPATVLEGMVSDGYGVDNIRLHITPIGENATWHPITRSGEEWEATMTFTETGDYALGVVARDLAGNVQEVGSFPLEVYESTQVADLSVAGSVSSIPAITSHPLTYTFTVHNDGPGIATAPTVTITLPTKVELREAPTSCAKEGVTLTCAPANIAADGTTPLDVQVHVPLTTTGKLVAIVEVSGEKIDLWPDNNRPEPLHTPTYQPITDLEMGSDSPTILGEPTTFNAATATGTDVHFDWQLGDGEIATSPSISHTYPAAGVYTAVVTASNDVNALTATTLITTDIPVGTPLLEEGFEGHLAAPDWLHTEAVEERRWQRTGERAHSGLYSVFYDDFFRDQDGWLVTGQVTPTLKSELVFWQYQRYATDYDKHSVWVSTGSQDPKDGDFVELTELGPGAGETWEQVRVGLSDYAGQPVYMAFRYEGNFADEWYVDDVQVTVGLVTDHDGPTTLGETTAMTASLATGTNVRYDWDFGDGQTATGPHVSHAYTKAGDHTVVVTASNSVSAVTATMEVAVRARIYLPLVMSSYSPPCRDAYEPNDTWEEASAIAADGTAQAHTFHQPGDVDWIAFEVADANTDYVIQTLDLAGADTVIYLYDSGGERLLDWNDDASAATRASHLRFDPYHTGTFYVRIENYNPELGGCDVSYSIRVIGE